MTDEEAINSLRLICITANESDELSLETLIGNIELRLKRLRKIEQQHKELCK